MRSKAQSLIKESNKKLGNLTDKQIEQYQSEGHKKQFLQRASKGGEVAGHKNFNTGVGLFGMSKEKKKQTAINGGKAAGKLAAERGTVVKAGKISIKSPKHPNNVTVKCYYCGKLTKLPMNRRWHGENCKMKNKFVKSK